MSNYMVLSFKRYALFPTMKSLFKDFYRIVHYVTQLNASMKYNTFHSLLEKAYN